METKEKKIGYVSEVFHDTDSVEQAIKTLHEHGYTNGDIDLIMSDDTRKKYFAKGKTEIGNKALEGAGTGGVIGGTVGIIAAIVAAIGTSFVIPGLGLVVAGPLAAAFAGAGAGGVAGGLIGALVGAGIPEERARLYEKEIKNGKIVMGIRPHNEEDAKHFHSQWADHSSEAYK